MPGRARVPAVAGAPPTSWSGPGGSWFRDRGSALSAAGAARSEDIATSEGLAAAAVVTNGRFIPTPRAYAHAADAGGCSVLSCAHEVSSPVPCAAVPADAFVGERLKQTRLCARTQPFGLPIRATDNYGHGLRSTGHAQPALRPAGRAVVSGTDPASWLPFFVPRARRPGRTAEPGRSHDPRAGRVRPRARRASDRCSTARPRACP